MTIGKEGVGRSVGLRAVMKTDVLEVNVIELGRLLDLLIVEEVVVVGRLPGH